MRVAALYDIHGNLPALEAVLAEVEAAAPDLVVVGGDVVAGPLPGETLDRLVALGDRVRWVMGNADRMVVEAYDRGGRPEDPEDAIDRLDAWVARQLTPTQRDRLGEFEPLVRVEVDGLGPVLFCHGSPRSDKEIITAVSPDARLAPMVDGSRRTSSSAATPTPSSTAGWAGGACSTPAASAGRMRMPAAYWLCSVRALRCGARTTTSRRRSERLRASGLPERRRADAAREPARAGRARRRPRGELEARAAG